jgi:hypothetical protein
MLKNDNSKFQLSQEQKDFHDKTWGLDEIQLHCSLLTNNLRKASVRHPELMKSANLVSHLWADYNLIKAEDWEKERNRLFRTVEPT